MSKARTKEPVRNQSEMRFEVPDEAVDAEHPVRAIWQALGALDLSRFLGGAPALEPPTHSPRTMLTLWTYAISDGVGSPREIARLVQRDRAYAWICRGVALSHQSLSDFRLGHRAAMDELVTDALAALMRAGLLSLRPVAQDGMRVRAAESAPSSLRLESREACREQAALHVKAVLAEADDPEIARARQTAREAAARDFQRRFESAVATLQERIDDRRRAPRDEDG